MGKQSPKKRKSEVNSNETPKKAKVVVDTPKTPVNSPVKQTPQKNNKTPKSQKKQKPQTPVMNGVASKKVQIKENNQNTPASTPGKGKGEKKYPVTPATKGNVVTTPKKQEKVKKTPPGTPNKQNEGKLAKFTGVKSLDGSPATSPANIKKEQNIIIPTEVATGLSKRQMKRMRLKLRKVAVVGTKMENVEKKGSDSAAKKSIKEIAENVAEGEKPMSKSQKKRLKKIKKMASEANAETTNAPENSSVQSPKAKKNKKKGKNKNQAQQANGNQVAAVKDNENAKNKKQKGNQKKENQQQQQQQQQKKKKQQKQKVEQKEVEAEDDKEEESDYEVETSIKPEKVSKKMNETEDSDNDGADVLDTGDEEMEDESDDDADDDDNEETDNSVNENNENEQKDQTKPKKQKNKNAKGKQAAPKDLNDAGILKKGQSRYVLFVGNLPFDADKQQVTEHFNKTCEVKDVRIPTDKQSSKPRGFAYLEVPNEDSYHKALALHHSFVNGRRINVLYTQGGTKNSDDMKQKIKSKNFKLQAMRRDGKLPGGVKDAQKRSVRRAKKRSFDNNTE